MRFYGQKLSGPSEQVLDKDPEHPSDASDTKQEEAECTLSLFAITGQLELQPADRGRRREGKAKQSALAEILQAVYKCTASEHIKRALVGRGGLKEEVPLIQPTCITQKSINRVLGLQEILGHQRQARILYVIDHMPFYCTQINVTQLNHVTPFA